VLAFVVDVGYESEKLYDSIFEDSINGGKLGFHYNFSGS
jgi:hypothetical protein